MDKKQRAMKRNALRIVSSTIKDMYGFVVDEDEIEMSQEDAESLLRDDSKRGFRERIDVDIKIRGPHRSVKVVYVPGPEPAGGTYG